MKLELTAEEIDVLQAGLDEAIGFVGQALDEGAYDTESHAEFQQLSWAWDALRTKIHQQVEVQK